MLAPIPSTAEIGTAKISAVESARVVDRVRKQAQIACALDCPYDTCLLSAAGTRATSWLNLTDWRKEPGKHVETFVVDLFGLELRREFFSIYPGDDRCSWCVYQMCRTELVNIGVSQCKSNALRRGSH